MTEDRHQQIAEIPEQLPLGARSQGYNVPSGVTTVRFHFDYQNVTALLGNCGDTVSAFPDRAITFTPCLEDNNACTVDTCETRDITQAQYGTAIDTSCQAVTGTIQARDGVCLHTPVVCDDQNACTTDTCDPATGCVFTPNPPCNDNNACTTDTCDPALGCVFTANPPCNDNNACTTDTCDPVTGCVFTPVNCDDGNACTTDTCDPTSGCVHTGNANCQAGCTPGFWKNCTGQWPISTGTLLSDAFPCLQAANLPACLSGCSAKFSTISLLNALSLKGGSTTCGGAETLARAAAAAYLNSLKVGYPIVTTDLVAEVCTAFASCDRATIIAEAARLDAFNNLGCKDAQGNDLPCKLKL